MAATRYIVQVQTAKGGEFEDTDFSRSEKSRAVAEADRRTAEDKVGTRVVTGAGTVVHENDFPKLRVISVHTKPYTKDITATLTDELKALVPEGYTAAYRRPRNMTTVLRSESEDVAEDRRYAVLDERRGKISGYAPTTRAAGALMKGLGAKVKNKA